MDKQPVRRLLAARDDQRERLRQIVSAGRHLGQTGKGFMIEDPEVVASVTALSERLGVPKHELVRQLLLDLKQALDNGTALPHQFRSARRNDA